MTASDIVFRTEQAMLGAMIKNSGHLPSSACAITTDLFTDLRHQAIFMALTRSSSDEAEPAKHLWGPLAGRSRHTREAAAYMERLPRLCPDAANADIYARLLHEAKAQREAPAQRGEREADSSEVLAAAAERLSRAGDYPHGLSPGVTGLARSLGGPARQLLRAREEAEHVAPASAGPGGCAPADSDQRASAGAVQDLVLASMMRDPAEAREIVGWLPADAFAGGPQRELFGIMAALVRDRRTIDPIVIAWEVCDRRPNGPGELLTSEFVLRVGMLSVTPGIAPVLGRMLLAEQVCTARFGAGWASSRLRVLPA